MDRVVEFPGKKRRGTPKEFLDKPMNELHVGDWLMTQVAGAVIHVVVPAILYRLMKK